MAKEKSGLYVEVKGDNIDAALRVLKRKMTQEGVLNEMKRRRYYEKPSEEKRRRNAESRRRQMKMQAEQQDF